MSQITELLAINLRRLRKSAGLTQEKLSELSGVSLDMIQRTESQKSWPSPELIEKLALALKVSELSLYEKRTDANEPKVDAKAVMAKLVEIEQRLESKTEDSPELLLLFDRLRKLAQLDKDKLVDAGLAIEPFEREALDEFLKAQEKLSTRKAT